MTDADRLSIAEEVIRDLHEWNFGDVYVTRHGAGYRAFGDKAGAALAHESTLLKAVFAARENFRKAAKDPGREVRFKNTLERIANHELADHVSASWFQSIAREALQKGVS